jgi:ACS family allantoate permease-like MFS transporter
MFSVTLPMGGITVFSNILIAGFGFSSMNSLLLSMPAGVLLIIFANAFVILSKRVNNRCFAVAAASMLQLLGMSLMFGLGRNNPNNAPAGQLIGYYIVFGNSPSATILFLSMIESNSLGFTKKTTVNAIANIGYTVGFLAGPQLYHSPPKYTPAKITAVAVWAFSILLCVLLHFINEAENKKRDRQAEEGSEKHVEGQEFMDLTDGENKQFRYAI